MSLRKANNMHCKECCYDPLSGFGGWKQQVKSCTCTLDVRTKSSSKRSLSKTREDTNELPLQ